MKSRAELSLLRLDDYLPPIVDRLASFDATVDRRPDGFVFQYPFGAAFLGTGSDSFTMEVTAENADGLQRVRELVTVAVQIYAKAESPAIVWRGDLAGDNRLATFRKMRVLGVDEVTPRMRRVRLQGDDLARYGAFGGMHLRLLFPTLDNPDPVWPLAGPNGQPLWPDEKRRPAARVYTIRRLDVAEGWMDIDFVVHGDGDGCEGIGSAWAMNARPGDEIGIIGPVGRPVREADWYVLGCDETGLPAVSRLLERMAPETRGVAFIEVADGSERQEIRHPKGVALNWIHRDGVPAGEHGELADAVARVEWPADSNCFGWFAAEAEPVRRLREYWRGTLSYGRDQTLVAGYWRRGQSGVMAG
jgi:NADPH-dependent ferric siderophore reductase